MAPSEEWTGGDVEASRGWQVPGGEHRFDPAKIDVLNYDFALKKAERPDLVRARSLRTQQRVTCQCQKTPISGRLCRLGTDSFG